MTVRHAQCVVNRRAAAHDGSCCIAVSDDPSLYLWMNLFMFGRLFLMLRVVRYHSPLLSSNGRFIGCVLARSFSGAG